MRSKRFQTSVPQRADWSEQIVLHLQASKVFRDARTIHVFWPMVERGEVDVKPLIESAYCGDKVVLLPVVKGSSLEHAPFNPDDPMIQGAFGQWEPTTPTVQRPLNVDLVLLPGLAVDRHGNRLGYGGGYYDRFLQDLHQAGSEPVLMMTGFGFQMIEQVPTSPKDVAVHAFATETGIQWLSEPSQSL